MTTEWQEQMLNSIKRAQEKKCTELLIISNLSDEEIGFLKSKGFNPIDHKMGYKIKLNL
jgi:hypothetical protein